MGVCDDVFNILLIQQLIEKIISQLAHYEIVIVLNVWGFSSDPENYSSLETVQLIN